MPSFLLGKYLGVEWLDHTVGVCLTFKKQPNCFSKRLYHFTLQPAVSLSFRVMFLSNLGIRVILALQDELERVFPAWRVS